MLCYRTEARTCALALIAIVCITSERSEAKDRWTNDTGKHHVEAEFVELQGEILVLRSESGKKITVPLAKLDEASRRLAQTRAAELAKQQDNPAPKSTILTLEQLNERARGSIRPDDNMVVAFWSAVGSEAIHRDEAIRRKYLDALGGNVVEPAVPFVSWFAFVKAEGNGQNFGHDHSPLLATDANAVERWLARNEAPLDAVVAAVSRPAYFSPTILEADDDPLWKSIIPIGIPAKDVARGLLTRAQRHRRHGDLDSAVNDAIAVLRLSRHLNRESTLIGLLMARAMESMAIESVAATANDERFTRTAADQLNQRTRGLPPRADFIEKLDFEKASDANIITRIAEEGPRELLNFIVDYVGQSSPESVAWADTDAGRTAIATSPQFWEGASRPVWSGGAVEVASIYDGYSRNLAAEPVFDRGSRFEQIFNEERVPKLRSLFTTKDQSPETNEAKARLFSGRLPPDATAEDIALCIHRIVCPDLEIYARLDADAAVREALLPTVIALGLYKADHSELPLSLKELTPEYLTTPPMDPLFDQELVFKPDVGGYALYSTGKNGVDDGGTYTAEEDKDDIGLIAVPSQ